MNFSKKIILLGKIIIAIAVLWFLTHTSQLQFSLLINIFHQPFLLSVVILTILFTILVCAWRWRTLNAAQDIHLGFLHTIKLTYQGIAFNSLLPGAVGGDFIRMFYVFKYMPDKKSGALLSVFFDRALGLLGIVIAVCFVTIFHIKAYSQNTELFYLILVCLAVCCIGLILFAILVSLPQEIRFNHWISQRYSAKRWAKPVISVLDAMQLYKNAKMAIVKALGLSVLIQILMVVTTLIIANMLGFPSISFGNYLIAIGVTQIVNLIPIAPGGVGVGEMAFAKVLSLLDPGVSGALATIFLMYRLLSGLVYLPGVVVGLFGTAGRVVPHKDGK